MDYETHKMQRDVMYSILTYITYSLIIPFRQLCSLGKKYKSFQYFSLIFAVLRIFSTTDTGQSESKQDKKIGVPNQKKKQGNLVLPCLSVTRQFTCKPSIASGLKKAALQNQPCKLFKPFNHLSSFILLRANLPEKVCIRAVGSWTYFTK